MSSRRESDFHRIEQLLLEAQRARQEADQRTEKERRARLEANHRVEEEHRARQEADRALQNKLQLNHNTTLEEFLQACHEYYLKPLRIETNKSWTTQGTTDPAGKYYPKITTPWEGFPQNQSKEFQRVCSIFHPSQQTALRLFSSIPYIKQHGKDYCNIHIANESSLRIYEKVAVEVQVISIINGLREIEQGRKQFQLGQEIFFGNDGNSLSDVAKEIQERLQIQSPRTLS